MDEQMQQKAIEYIAALISDQTGEASQVIQQAAQNGDQAADYAINVIDAYNQGDKQATQIVEFVAQQLQGGQPQQPSPQDVTYAKFGAKLNYIKYLNGECPEGYEMKMFKQGGRVCKKCMKKKEEGGNMPKPTSVQEDFKTQMAKCGGKAKKPKKEEGGPIPEAKYGNKMKKACGGVKMPFKANGGSFPFYNN